MLCYHTTSTRTRTFLRDRAILITQEGFIISLSSSFVIRQVKKPVIFKKMHKLDCQSLKLKSLKAHPVLYESTVGFFQVDTSSSTFSSFRSIIHGFCHNHLQLASGAPHNSELLLPYLLKGKYLPKLFIFPNAQLHTSVLSLVSILLIGLQTEGTVLK